MTTVDAWHDDADERREEATRISCRKYRGDEISRLLAPWHVVRGNTLVANMSTSEQNMIVR